MVDLFLHLDAADAQRAGAKLNAHSKCRSRPSICYSKDTFMDRRLRQPISDFEVRTPPPNPLPIQWGEGEEIRANPSVYGYLARLDLLRFRQAQGQNTLVHPG